MAGALSPSHLQYRAVAVRDTTVGNETGIGGRNQEFCLSAARWIAGSKNIVFGSVDTDGTDGPGVQYTGMIEGMQLV